MPYKRKNFTENQKAKIFARDRATCAFSGLSLWLLDNGIKSNYEIDWVDHIQPSASGGGAELENGICASRTFNAKKKANAHDKLFLVKEGKLTEHYVQVWGCPPKHLMEQLQRLKNLEPHDWFFNKSLSGLFEGYEWRCDKEFKGKVYKRDDSYWFKAGWRRLQKYQKNKGAAGLVERGLVKTPLPFGSDKLLELETIEDEANFLVWADAHYGFYRASYQALYNYFYQVQPEQYAAFMAELEQNQKLHPEVVEAIKAHWESCSD